MMRWVLSSSVAVVAFVVFFFLSSLTGANAFKFVVVRAPAPSRGAVGTIVMAASKGGDAKPPVGNLKRPGDFDYGSIIAQAAKAATEAIKTEGLRLLSIDFPANEGPTNVKRFETDRDFCQKLLAQMGYKTVLPIGDEIIIGKNLKIGEYLNLEGLTGFTGKGFGAGVPSSSVNVVLNPSLDASNLRDLQKQMDDGSSPVILVNCNLEKLNFVDKLLLGKYVEGFKPAYVFKKVNLGFLFKNGPSAPWETWAIFTDLGTGGSGGGGGGGGGGGRAGGPYLEKIDSVAGGAARPKYLEVENKVKAAVAANLEAQREAAEEAKALNKKGASAAGPKGFWG